MQAVFNLSFTYKPHCEKTSLRGFRPDKHKPGCTTTRLEISDLGSKGIVLSVYGKTKALFSCTVTAQLICVFSHNEAHMVSQVFSRCVLCPFDLFFCLNLMNSH